MDSVPSQLNSDDGYDFRSESVFRSSPTNLERTTTAAHILEQASRSNNLESSSVIESEIFSTDLPPRQQPLSGNVHHSSPEQNLNLKQSILPPSSPPEIELNSFPQQSFHSIFLDSSPAEPPSFHPARSKIQSTATTAAQPVPNFMSRFEPLPSSSPIFGPSSPKRKRHTESPPSLKELAKNQPPSGEAASPRKARRTQTEKTASQLEKERQRKRREHEKQSKLADRNYQKALNEANRRKTQSLEESLKELRTIVSKNFLTNSRLGQKLQDSLIAGQVKIEHLPENEADILDCFDVNVFYLRRVVTSKYDVEMDMFVPIAQHVANMPLALVVVDGAELAKTRFGSKTEIVKHFHEKVRSRRPSTHETPECTTLEIICIVQGLTSLLRQSFNSRNQVVTDRVRELMGDGSSTTRRKPNSKNDLMFDPHLLDEACTDLEFLHNWKIVHSVDSAGTADWVISLLANHSVSWYKSKTIESILSGGVIDGDVGYIKSGTNPRDCMEKSLQQIKYVSSKIAADITNNYDNMQKLAAASHLLDQHVGKSLAQSISVLITSDNPDRIM